MDDLARLDATAQAELVRDGQLSATELVSAAIERIGALNPQLNAVIHELFEEAVDAAAAGPPDGPFTGVPFLLKDLGASLAGQPLHMGMKALKDADFKAPVDTYLARRFLAAGLVTVGKTNTPELGILPTTEPDAYGPTHNPWDTRRSPGGSSGGAAAAVAAGMVPVAHASDGGGSIRVPASACGLVGLKPTRQRVSQGPLIGDLMSGLTAELVISRSVRDTAAVLDAVQGAGPGDPYAAPAPARPYTTELEADPARLRIGLSTVSLTGVEAEPDVIDAARDAAELLESLGHDVEESMPAGLEAFDLVETFLTRWTAGQALTLEQLGGVLRRRLGPGDVEPLTWALAERGRRCSAPEYLGAIARHHAMTRVIAAWYEDGFDLLLTPTLGEPPLMLGELHDSGDDPMRAIERAQRTVTFTALLNATGQPAISLPLFWNREGLPIGVQLVAVAGREDLLIRVAAELERSRPWADRTPPVFAGATAPA
jgi:amidase